MTLRKLQLLCACALIALTACETNPKRIQYATPTKYKQVEVPHIFSDNMVLQQGMSVPVWGWGPEGEVVTVTFRNQTVRARVKKGQWMVKLSNLTPGAPDTLTITAGNGQTMRFTNVLVGEVWLASGQSNMEFKLKRAFEANQDIASASNPNIRFIDVPNTRLHSPTNNINATWVECNPESAANISAVAYYFARALQKERGVPIGIVESDWGGTPAEAWTPWNTVAANPTLKKHYIEEGDNTPTNLGKKRKAWQPGELYNGMIAPLVPFAIRGAIWYQGEANAHGEKAKEYRLLLATMITKWRAVFGHDFPFLIVQLAPFIAPPTKELPHQPQDSAWAMLRESQQFLTTALPKVGTAVITDVGEQHDIHPTKKKPVGERLALAARHIAYGEGIEYSGPTLKKARVEGNKIVLTFDHADGGLVARDGALKGFAICGPDKKFVWAEADIVGKDKVVVSSPAVPKPVAVRYGWADFPVVNLWNEAGLPASPFRTDNF